MLNINMFDICRLTVSTLLSLTMYWLKVDCCEVKTLYGILSSGVYFENQLDNSDQCQRLCWYSTSCRSCSWGKMTGLCQLSKDTKDKNPDAFSVSQYHIYTDALSPPCLEVNHPCTNRPCSLTEICVPIERVTSYVCLHMITTDTDTTAADTADAAADTDASDAAADTDATTATVDTDTTPATVDTNTFDATADTYTTAKAEIQQTMTSSSLASTTAVTTSTTDAVTITSSTTASPTSTTTDICIEDCEGRPDGNYQCCDSCDVYCACSGQDLNKMPCPLTTVWDNNKRRCDDTSDTCKVNE